MKFNPPKFITSKEEYNVPEDIYADIDMKLFSEAKRVSRIDFCYNDEIIYKNAIIGKELEVPSDKKVLNYTYVEDDMVIEKGVDFFSLISEYKPDSMESVEKVEFDAAGSYDGGVYIKLWGMDYSDFYKKYLEQSKNIPKFVEAYKKLLADKKERSAIEAQIAELQKKLK